MLKLLTMHRRETHVHEEKPVPADSPWFPRSGLVEEAVSLARARSLLWRTATDRNTIFKISPDVQNSHTFCQLRKKSIRYKVYCPKWSNFGCLHKLFEKYSCAKAEGKPLIFRGMYFAKQSYLIDLTIQQKLTSHYSTTKTNLDIMCIFT